MHNNLLATLITLAIFAADQLIKLAALFFRDGFILPPLSWLNLSPSVNRGIAFSLPFPRTLLIVLSLGIMGLVLQWWHKQERHAPSAAVGLGLFLGGALGNLFDRIFRHGVIDYLNIGTGSFNLADGAIILGILLLFLSHHRLAKNA